MPTANAQSVFATKADVLDGETWDLAGPSDFNSVGANARVWLGQGRSRIAISATTRQRMESRTFFGFEGAPTQLEQPIAIEYANLTKRLYTLTADDVPGTDQPSRWCLYVEDATNPASPQQMTFYRFVDQCWDEPLVECTHESMAHFPAWDPLQDIKLWEEPNKDDVIIVRTRKRVLTMVLKTNTEHWNLELRGFAKELYKEGRGPGVSWGNGTQWFKQIPPAVPPENGIDAYKMAYLVDLALGRDAGSGRLMAYVLGEMGGYGLERPLPMAMIACDLDEVGNFEEPTFDANPSAESITYRVYNPLFDIPLVGSTYDQRLANTALHISAFNAGSQSFVDVGCAYDKQLRRINVTNLFSPSHPAAPFIPNTYVTEIDFATVHNNPDIWHVLAHPDTPLTKVYAATGQDFLVWDNTSGTPVISNTIHGPASEFKEPTGNGCPRDGFVMKNLPVGVFSTTAMWLALIDTVDYIGKVFDLVVPPSPNNYVHLIDEFYGINSSDGAVAIPPAGAGYPDVYIPTFGGVAHYVWDATLGNYKFANNPASYQSTEEPPDSGIVDLTEHIDVGRVPTLTAPQDELYTAPATAGAFTRFSVTTSSKDPGPAKRFNPEQDTFNAAIEAASGCNTCTGGTGQTCSWCLDCPTNAIHCAGADSTYGNDVVFLDMSQYFGATASNKFLLTELTRWDVDGGPTTEFQTVLTIYRWNELQGIWQHFASVASPSISTDPGSQQITLSITVARHQSPTEDKLYAYVSHDVGLMAFDITGLPQSGTTLGALQYKQNIDTGYVTSAAAVVKNYVFCVVNLGVPEQTFHLPGKFQLYGQPASPPGVLHSRCYEWVGGTAPLDYRSSQIWANTLPPTTQPTNPGPSIRGRVRVAGGSTGAFPNHDVFFACHPYLTRWRWPGGTSANPDPTLLNLTGYWRSSYDVYLQDCRVYDLNLDGSVKPYVLAAKDLEAFALTGPVDVP